MDEKLKARIENLKDMVLYRFGSTGVVQVLSRAAELLGLVPVFPVRNVTSFSSGASGSNAVFRDCVLVKKNTTVAEVARKVMGDAPLAYVEGAGGVRVAEDDLVAVGKNDVSPFSKIIHPILTSIDSLLQSRTGLNAPLFVMSKIFWRSRRAGNVA
jgi:ribosome-binding ATPase YchF (GTP1/OBG family)